MNLKVTNFYSSDSASSCPMLGQPEYAFIGRSNVGKSSLINFILGQKVAFTSSKPGKTQLINHFFINNNLFYGFFINANMVLGCSSTIIKNPLFSILTTPSQFLEF